MSYLSFVLISVLFISCNSKEGVENNSVLKKTYYDNGKIKTEEWFKDDTIKHGIFKKYYEDGTLGQIVNYKNNQREGEEKSYYPNGVLEYSAYNKNNKSDSVAVWYHENGNIAGKYNYLKGVFFGDQFKYDLEGGITSYYFNNIEGFTLFERYYNNGKILKDSGSPFFLVYNKNELLLNEQFESILYIAIPPNCSYKLGINEYKNKSKVTLGGLRKNYKRNYYAHTFYLDKIFKERGEYKWEIVLTLKDTVNLVEKVDTSFVNIIVK